MEAAAEDPVGGGEERDWGVEGPVEGAGPPGRWEVQQGGAGLSRDYGRGQVVPAEEEDAVSTVSELEVREWVKEQGAGAGAGEEGAGGTPLFLPTPAFMASAGTA